MAVVTMHEHVNQCFTHDLHRKFLCFRLNGIVMKTMTCREFSIDDAQQFINYQENRRIGINRIKLIGHCMPVISKNSDVINSCKRASTLNHKLLAEQKNAGHVEFIWIVLACATKRSQQFWSFIC